MRDAFALGGGPYHFFDRSSRSAAASNICSANSFFSLAFSSSSCFSRLASETSMPPYLAFELYSVASETPCLRARSAVFAPASCSFSTPMICSSVNRARFICPSLFQGRTLNPRGGKSQWQVSRVGDVRLRGDGAAAGGLDGGGQGLCRGGAGGIVDDDREAGPGGG